MVGTVVGKLELGAMLGVEEGMLDVGVLEG